MRLALAPLLLICAPAGLAQQPHEQEIQRALIQLDRRAAEFARGAAPAPLEPTVGRPLHPDPELARQLRPYERMKATEAGSFTLRLPPPVERRKGDKPLPLPGERG